MSSRAWLNLLRAGCVLACVYHLLGGTVQVLAYQVFGVLATGGILVATRYQARSVRRAWYLLVASLSCYLATDLVYGALELNGAYAPGSPLTPTSRVSARRGSCCSASRPCSLPRC